MILWMVGLQAGATASADAVVQTLSMRHPVPCASLDTTAETLRDVVQTVSMPSWVPMRAAQCLIEDHAPLVEADLNDWVVDPKTRGLGLLVLTQLDLLPSELAVRVARLALTHGPDPVRAAKHILDAHHAEVRALVTP